MGNRASSCFLAHSSPRPRAKLIDCEGNLRQVNVPIKAAEVMLEEPGHFISPVGELRQSQRLIAMRADDELLAGKFYLLVRVSRVNGKVTKEDTAVIETACDNNKKKKMRNWLKRRKRSGAKVLPAVNYEFCEAAENESDRDQVTVFGGDGITDTGFSGNRFGKHRQWSPVLESISEVY